MAEEIYVINSFNEFDTTKNCMVEFKVGDMVQFSTPSEVYNVCADTLKCQQLNCGDVFCIVKIYKDAMNRIYCIIEKDGVEYKVGVKSIKLRHFAVKKSLQKNILNTNLDTCERELVEMKDLLCVMKNCDKVDTFERFVKFYRIRAKYAVEQREIDSYAFKVAELISTIRTFKNKMVELCENELLETIKTY